MFQDEQSSPLLRKGEGLGVRSVHNLYPGMGALRVECDCKDCEDYLRRDIDRYSFSDIV